MERGEFKFILGCFFIKKVLEFSLCYCEWYEKIILVPLLLQNERQLIFAWQSIRLLAFAIFKKGVNLIKAFKMANFTAF